jgi:signal transduction histidine kinase
MTANGQRTNVRERVLLDLARRDKSNPSDTFRGITEASAKALGVARVGIWRLLPDASAMVCEDLFVMEENRHERGDVLQARDCPVYFENLVGSRAILADDARRDPRTRDLSKRYLAPQSITSKMDVPIWHRGALYGVVSHEDATGTRHWRDYEATFAGNLADVVALSLEASERRAVESRWASVIDGMAEMVLVLDRNGQILQASPRTIETLDRQIGAAITLDERVRRLEYRDVVGRNIPKEDWPIMRALRGEEVREVVGVWRRAGAFLGYFRVLMKPLFAEGRVEGALALITDITEEIQFERLKEDLLAALARELEAPVTTITNHARIAARESTEPAWRAKFDAIGRASARMERLIDDLVEISNLRTGRLTLTREPVELQALIATQIQQIHPAAPHHYLRSNTREPITVVADRRRIEQVIRRLLDNAVRYSPSGGDVDVELSAEGDDVIISVRDHGIGIPVDKQPHVFDVFFRAHAGTAHDYGGLGIGLYLSREIARLHGGELSFESEESRGSTFRLRLPRNPRPPS